MPLSTHKIAHGVNKLTSFKSDNSNNGLPAVMPRFKDNATYSVSTHIAFDRIEMLRQWANNNGTQELPPKGEASKAPEWLKGGI